jgi:hypothetical protein
MKNRRAGRTPAAGEHAQPAANGERNEIASLQSFIAASTRLQSAILLHNTLEQHWIGSPVFEDGETVASLVDASAVERRLVAVERREIDNLSSEYLLQDGAQRAQLLRGLIHGFSHRELRISAASFDDYLERLDERDMGVSYFLPIGGKWRRATAIESARCIGMADDEDAPFWGELFTLPRSASYPSTLTLRGAAKSRKARLATHDVRLDTRAVARRVGFILAQALGAERPPRSGPAGKTEWPVRIVWPHGNRRGKGFSARNQHAD